MPADSGERNGMISDPAGEFPRVEEKRNGISEGNGENRNGISEGGGEKRQRAGRKGRRKSKRWNLARSAGKSEGVR